MRAGLWGMTAVFLGAFAAHFLLRDRGYVMVNYLGYVIEMSVPVLVLVLAGAYFAIRLLLALWRAPRRLGEVVAERRLKRAGRKLTQGLIHMAEGDWSRGERLLARSVSGTDSPLIHYLMAARAAQLQGSDERRDEWLKLAYEEMPEAETAVLLTQAELQLEHSDHERALATLRRIQEAHPDHPVALALLARIYHALKDWERLLALSPRLADARMDSDEMERFIASALEACTSGKDVTRVDIDRLWERLPAALRKAPRLIAQHGIALDALGQGDEAEKNIRKALRRDWDENLVLAYGRVRGAGAEKQLLQAEAWLKDRPEDSALLLTAARLCMVLELWGKARSYLETSLAITPRTESYALYGQLLDRFGEADNAALAFRSGLSLAVGGGDDLPALGSPDAVTKPEQATR